MENVFQNTTIEMHASSRAVVYSSSRLCGHAVGF